MTPVQKREVRATACRARASEASALAAASALDNVRQKHERAADRWRELAAMDETDAKTLRAPGPPIRPERADAAKPRLSEDEPCTA